MPTPARTRQGSRRPSSRCATRPATCTSIGFEPGDRLRPVRNANTTGHDEIAPTVWKGRLAYARRYGSDNIVPYTKLLAAARSHPSDRIGTLADAAAAEPSTRRECRVIKHTELAGMELWGRWIAQSWRYQPDGFPGFRQNEIRLTNVSRSDTRQIDVDDHRTSAGRPTSDRRSPADASRSCAPARAIAERASRNNSGAIRYRISSGRYELAGERRELVGMGLERRLRLPRAVDFACAGGEPGMPDGAVPDRPAGRAATGGPSSSTSSATSSDADRRVG